METYPKLQREYGQIQTSVLISQEFYKLCKEYNIKFSEALRVGVGVLLAEKGIKEYDNNLNFTRKLNKVTNKLSEISNKFYLLLSEAKERGVDVSKFEDGD